MLGAKNQHLQNGNFLYKNGQHSGLSITSKFPRQDLQFPWEISRTSSTRLETTQGRGTTFDRQNRSQTAGLEGQVLVLSGERDSSKNGSIISTNLSYDRIPRIKMVNQKDRSLEKEFPMEGRNARQGIWWAFHYQLANNM